MTADLRPEGELTVVAASQLRDQWLAWLTETAGGDFAEWPAVSMDLAAIEAFDSAGAQLLLSLRHSLMARGQTLLLQSPPACVTDALERFGLEGDVLPHSSAQASDAPDSVDADEPAEVEPQA